MTYVDVRKNSKLLYLWFLVVIVGVKACISTVLVVYVLDITNASCTYFLEFFAQW